VDLIAGGAELGLTGPVIDLGDTLVVPGAERWLRLTAADGEDLGANPYGAISLVRTNLPGNQISFVTGGQLIIAPVDAPANPTAQLPFTGVDYDLAPDGERIVVSDGRTLSIVDLSGAEVGTFPNPEGISIGSVVWQPDGSILFVDLSSNVVRSVDPGDAG
ncbi:MAG: hypothetical protein H0W06_04660, partial [Chloroflexia bacterium]|nr:hypothetical protein [Chloroflexia bacterium]